MWKTTFKSLKWYGMLSRAYDFKFFSGCLPQILLGLFLNALFHLSFKNLSFYYDNRFLFSRKMNNIRSWREVRLQKIIKVRLLGCFCIFQISKKWRIVWEEFFLVSAKCFEETSNISFNLFKYLLLCHFLISWNLRDWSYSKDIYSITFSNNNWKRRYI